MNAPSERTPEAQLLFAASRRKGLSAAVLAARLDNAVGVDTVRNWLKGYRTVKAGETAKASPSAFQMAKLAVELEITASQLRDVGRGDAADELETVSTSNDDVDDLRYRKPEGWSDERWQEHRARLNAIHNALLDAAAQER